MVQEIGRRGGNAVTGHTTIDRETFQRRTGLTESDLRVVAQNPIFDGCSWDALSQILIDSAIQEFPRNAVVFLQGEPAQRFYIVLNGWVKVFRETLDGRESVLHVFGPAESFAEAVIYETKGFPASASACVDVRILGIPSASFKLHLAENAGLSVNFMTAVSNKLRLLSRQVEQLAARSAAERLAGYLSGLCSSDSATAVVRLPLEKAVIAAKLGMQPETFSRSISKLRSVGVHINGDKVDIRDVYALRRLGEGAETADTQIMPLPQFGRFD